jgi:hypothetical protein
MRRWQEWRWVVAMALTAGVFLGLASGIAGGAEAPVPQSLLIVAPHLTFLVAVTLVCFAVCYACFMRQEIRST